MSSDAPGLDPATFDLDAWLDGVQRPRAIVTLYARPDLMASIDALVAELEPLLARRDAQQDADVALVDVGQDGARIAELRAELKNEWEQYEASGMDVELTQMPAQDVDDLMLAVHQEIPDPDPDAAEAERLSVIDRRNRITADRLVIGSVTAAGPHGQPRTPASFTAATLAKMRTRFGVDQVSELISQARLLAFEGQVDAPFSRRVSAALTETLSA